MKKIDKIFKLIFVGACLTAICIIGLVVNSSENQKINNEHYSKKAFQNSQSIERTLNDIALDLYIENEISKNSYTSASQIFVDEVKIAGDLSLRIDSIINDRIMNTQEIVNVQANFIDNETKRIRYFNKSMNMPVSLDEVGSDYLFWYRVDFDKLGNQKVQSYDPEVLLNITTLSDMAIELKSVLDYEENQVMIKTPELKDCTLIFAVPSDMQNRDTIYYDIQEYSENNRYVNTERTYYYALLFVIIGLIFVPIKRIKEGKLKKWLEESCGEVRLASTLFIILFTISIPLQGLFDLESLIYKEATYMSDGYYLLIAYLFIIIVATILGLFMVVYWIKIIFRDGWKESFKKFRTKEYLIVFWNTMKKWFYACLTIKLSRDSSKKLIGIIIINIFVLFGMTVFFGRWVGSIFYSILLFVLILKIFKEIRTSYEKLLKCTQRLSQGELDVEINESLGAFEPLKDELENIRIGFKVAIEEETKSQKMKTELISNVSHDLKTPLTSMISYIDLLKKETNKEKKKEYLETVERNSLRLKHLIDDLFEVSKANSGELRLDIIEVDLVSLINQTLFELNPQIEKSGLIFKKKYYQEKVIAKLDAHKTYRIIENLISNAVKYSLQDSRVYIVIEEIENKTRISIRNTSKSEIDFDPNDIVERFVRGDSSRNSEGSGLGLAIAKGFTEAQHGAFRIETDGDIFKVIVEFKNEEVI